MTSRERVRAIIGGTAADRMGFWLGMPQEETWGIYHRYFGTKSAEELRVKLGDDLRWITPQWIASTYGKGGESLDGIYKFPKKAHGDPGPFARTESVQEVHDFPWPKAGKFDFTETVAALKAAGPMYRASGFWTCFYHNVMDLFGMENYLVKMYENPAVVHAVTDHICQYYYEANEAFFAAAGEEADGFFFGNDFGTQLDCIISPALFDEFVMPWFRKFTEQGHRWGKQVILHSCGSIYRLIEARVDCLHPLQARASNMSAEYLAEHFKGRIAFLGGVDTQDLLVNGTPAEIRRDVRRIRGLLGPRLIVSPSHEAILPNVPAANVAAMAEAAGE